jgi:glycosyltransferase involved in cell wall biosynthesis
MLAGPSRPSLAMHVLLLNQAFAPDIVATAQMAKDLADHLVAEGHRVTVIASRSIYGQTGATLPVEEELDGVRVRRVGASLFGKAGYAARAADFGLFYALAALKAFTTDRPDVVLSLTTPPFIAAMGLLSRALRGTRAVYWVMDLYPDIPIACGLMRADGVAARVLEGLNRFLLERSDASVVLGRCMRERVLAKGVTPDKVQVIPVWSSDTDVRPVAHDDNPYRAKWGLEGKFAVMYSGNFGIGHDSATLGRAMARLRDRESLRFVFVGGGKRRFEMEELITAYAVQNAAWYGYQPREQLAASLSAGDVHLISLRAGLEGMMVPSKLFGIMAAGRPSIFIGHKSSEVGRVLLEGDCGLVVPVGDVDGLVRAIEQLAADPARCKRMGDNARRALVGRFDAKTACDSWSALLERVASGQLRAAEPGAALLG